MIITRREFDFIMAQAEGSEFDLAVDFGLATVRGRRGQGIAVLEDTYNIDLKQKVKESFCYLVKKDGLHPLAFFDQEKNRFYKLIPTRDWPSFTLGSVPMHSITYSSPREDTRRKIKLLSPYGIVLDTCMGLGYTALCAAEKSARVETYEPDENVRLLAELNPFSRELFTSPRIVLHQEDISFAISGMGEGAFDCIVHDPPTFKIAPELFSHEFYLQCRRVLKKGGRFYHYLPRYKIRSGYDFPSKVKEKCRKAGFKVLEFLPEQGDLLCTT